MFVLATACRPPTPAPEVVVFGGQGAQLQAEPSEPAPPAESQCTSLPPASTTTLLEDFEDGDHHLHAAPMRDGWWWSAHDGTAEAELSPPAGEFRPTPLPEDASSSYAMHLTADGQTGWGAAWGTSLRSKQGGTECPFNGSAFAGVRFRGKGQGTVALYITTPDSVPVDQPLGECEGKCWDMHGWVVRFTDEWQEFVFPFDRIQQGGWGNDAHFDRARMLGVQFSAKPESLPVELWVDDLAFMTPGEVQAWRDAPERSITPAPVQPSPSESTEAQP